MDLIARIIHAITQVHPLHPMLVHFPIGLTGGGAFFILLAVIYKNKNLETVAFTLVAGLAGYYDNLVNYEGDAPNSLTKIVLAIVMLLVTTGTAWLRWRNPDLFERTSTRPFYVAAYFVSFGLAIVLAFLGGVILYGF
jgi:uncharacterized membrane protein